MHAVKNKKNILFVIINLFLFLTVVAMAMVDGKVVEGVSVSDTAEQGSGSAEDIYSISEDGCFVAFESTATNLVSGDGKGLSDVSVRDRMLGTTMRTSVSSGETLQ